MTRSNRQLTQLAVNKVQQYLTHGPSGFTPFSAGNTSVDVDRRSSPHLVVSLFNKEIARLIMNPLDHRAVAGLVVSSGDFYDAKGRPSRTTRERLNGLLDALGTAGFIPQGVRVFLREDGACCVGKGDTCKNLDSKTPKAAILSHPSDLVFS